jgi:hypothetical protein
VKPVREMSFMGSPVAKWVESSREVYRICSCANTFLYCVHRELLLADMDGGGTRDSDDGQF